MYGHTYSFEFYYLITSNINQDCNLGVGAGIPLGNCKRESLSRLDKPPSCFPLHHLGLCLLIWFTSTGWLESLGDSSVIQRRGALHWACLLPLSPWVVPLRQVNCLVLHVGQGKSISGTLTTERVAVNPIMSPVTCFHRTEMSIQIRL